MVPVLLPPRGRNRAARGTYKQWSEAGAQVTKGEQSAYIVFYKEITVASDRLTADWRRWREGRNNSYFRLSRILSFIRPIRKVDPAAVRCPQSTALSCWASSANRVMQPFGLHRTS
jgi:hypothetical protein